MKAFEFYSSVSIYDIYVHNIVPFGRPYATQNVVELATSSSSRNDFLAGFFNACTINSVQVCIGPQDRWEKISFPNYFL